MYDFDFVPEILGPQAPAVAAALERLRVACQRRPRNPMHAALEAAVEDFLEACTELDRTEDANIAGADEPDMTWERNHALQVQARTNLMNYFQAGYALLDATQTGRTQTNQTDGGVRSRMPAYG